MINPISFTSVYKINYNLADNRNINKHNDIEDFCEDEDIQSLDIYQPNYRTSMSPRVPFSLSQTIIAPDEKDEMIDSYLAQMGIDYKKISIKELLSIPSVLSRIKPAPQRRTLALINSEKLEELLKNQPNNNFSHVKSDYEKYFIDETETQIKSGDEISAPALYLYPTSSKDDFCHYVDRFGADRLNPDSIIITLSKVDFETETHDASAYFALKDLGMKDIPVYLDDISYEVAEKLGLIVDNNQF